MEGQGWGQPPWTHYTQLYQHKLYWTVSILTLLHCINIHNTQLYQHTLYWTVSTQTWLNCPNTSNTTLYQHKLYWTKSTIYWTVFTTASLQSIVNIRMLEYIRKYSSQIIYIIFFMSNILQKYSCSYLSHIWILNNSHIFIW